ncbi:hypothetical protein EC973_008226 [Apophysomyces ossiformis]|uniref:Xylanolytic transcriptional activator regulatory domain-containing protein n=1 Tax=Apophysomyces ossiformis TaxID=679940 RepID=A0A8H7BT42_9FUNG|nr:hypothetical protein EC973_008226 [Apophysomyces ossiformis]
MSMDLGLHKRQCQDVDDTKFIDLELQKRVFWACYCLDKMQSMCSGRPWMLHDRDIDLDLPLLQPGDDLEEHGILEGFVACIKLMRLSERILLPESIYAPRPILQTQRDEQMSLQHDNELLHWLRTLPSHLQWTPYPTQSGMVLTQPPVNAMVAHIHLVYNAIELHVVRPYMSAKTVHQRCFAIATNITQLSCALAEQTNFILSYQFAAHAITAAVRVHAVDCGNEDLSFARHSRLMFQRSLRSLKSLFQHRNIAGIDQFATAMEWVISLADAGPSGSLTVAPQAPSYAQASPTFINVPVTLRECSPVSVPSFKSAFDFHKTGQSQKTAEKSDAINSVSIPFWQSTAPDHTFNVLKAEEQFDIKVVSTTDESVLRDKRMEEEMVRQQSYKNIGLGVYASAQQHRDDVISRHIPGLKSDTAARPVILTHHGQVIVTGSASN